MKHLPRRFGPIASMSARSVRRRLMPSVSNACAPTVLQNTSSRASTLRSDLPSAPRDRLRSLSRSLPRSSRSRAERADGETGRDPARRRSRLARDNKLLANIGGRPMVRVTADALLGAGCIEEVLVVTGHDAEAVERALEGLPVRSIYNSDWRDG